MQEIISKLRELQVLEAVKWCGGKCYLVGGVVRDYLLDKPIKDIDLLVTGVPMDILAKELALWTGGKVDLVGESFGVLKLNIQGFQEIDIALPRTETKVGDGHTGFDVAVDHTLPIEVDLKRRDFTMNAIAVDMQGVFIDPYGGRKDIFDGIIKCVDQTAFIEDPLRILRAYQFAARFGFDIDSDTSNLIAVYCDDLDQISGERISVELEKMVTKGDPKTVLLSMLNNGVVKALVGEFVESVYLTEFTYNDNMCGEITSIPQLLLLMMNFNPKQDHNAYHKFHKINERFKFSVDQRKEFVSLYSIYTSYVPHGVSNIVNTYRAGRKWTGLWNTNFFEVKLGFKFYLKDLFGNTRYDHLHVKRMRTIHEQIQQFNIGRYPKTKKDLRITSEELMNLGFEGVQMGEAYDNILLSIYQDQIKNTKSNIIAFLHA